MTRTFVCRGCEQDAQPVVESDGTHVCEHCGLPLTDQQVQGYHAEPDLPRTLRENLRASKGRRGETVPDDLESTCNNCSVRVNVSGLYWRDRQAWLCGRCHPEVDR